MNKTESKYFSTAARMDEAFLALLEKKDLPYITVKEICQQAGSTGPPFICITRPSVICWPRACSI